MSAQYRPPVLFTEDDRERLGLLSMLPPEIRVLIYKHLLVSRTPWSRTYGRTSNVSTEILSVCRTVYLEAFEHLYNTPHNLIIPTASCRPGTSPIPCPPVPPLHAIARMRKIRLSIHYETNNRGECEEYIRFIDRIVASTEPVALTLFRSTAITSLTIVLLNESQRKVGGNRFHLPKVTEQMRRILLPFAYLPLQAQVSIEGFQTNETAYQFSEMREAWKGQELPIEELLDDTLGHSGWAEPKKLQYGEQRIC